jgi:hypothetical protein
VTGLVTLAATFTATLSTILLPPCDIFMKLVRSMVTLSCLLLHANRVQRY